MSTLVTILLAAALEVVCPSKNQDQEPIKTEIQEDTTVLIEKWNKRTLVC